MPYDAHAQPGAATLADYALPGATEVPVLRIEHMETPSPYTRFGQKGIGEGGAIGPPAAIANAVNDALFALGARVDRPADHRPARGRGRDGRAAAPMKPRPRSPSLAPRTLRPPA